MSTNIHEKKLKKAEEKIRILENMIEDKTRELYVLNTELEQFIYIASHDLQEPLCTITSFADLLDDECKNVLDGNANDYLHFILQSALIMKLKIKGLLDYLLIGQDKDLTVVDCNILAVEVRERLSSTISETKTIFHIKKLPKLKGYRKELLILFENLISNAIKFRKKNSVPIIEISAQLKNDVWIFKVKDNGIGIDPIHQKKIFGIFRMLGSKNEYRSLGVGLFFCKKIVNIHGGRIWLDSCSISGSTFYFTIPNMI
ncbi:sensor histidine kinase [Flavivirga spongiicola]|uniref:histidine kinase n=1 Tax=Flavivirga spongiicola TaxID=421621 RepID=A0ABU7XYB4_9FLAO|nr:ATP-binding protein [Flavivirga sp. MEBiC05379]MDO5980786.1 ATP-binding protein [Flavivirga sp. MEBiC05379]